MKNLQVHNNHIIPFIIVILIFGLFITAEWWCPSMWGSHKLGNNLYAMDWDGGVQIIVYNDNPHGRTVYSGAYVIPNPNTTDSIYNVRIQNINFNKKWVIVKAESVTNNKECYFLIDKSFNLKGLDWQKDNCDSIIQSHITEYSDFPTFYQELQNRKIELDFGSVSNLVIKK
ncbi:hypothetical protein FACS189429_1830 [Bacteroidia bacterium]|nr:hypothetical protein FACS189429_1830 [Bacteroidia bacterium]GHV44111.1 hypothetical protein FACS1894180_5030 [Bacteroidia bacterium]